VKCGNRIESEDVHAILRSKEFEELFAGLDQKLPASQA
jgi:hypothetical protein